MFAYNITFCSKAAGNLIKQVLVLPSESALRALMKSKCQKLDLNIKIILALGEQIAQKESKFKKYVLIFDEMSIKPQLCYYSKSDIIVGFEDLGGLMGCKQKIATQLLVLMVRNISGKKKMPIGFFSRNAVASSYLQSIIEDAIDKLQEYGIDICDIACDKGANNIGLFSMLRSTVTEPHFIRNGKKIFTSFDSPHLLKSLTKSDEI